VKFTGERVILGECDSDLMNEHVARYLFAKQFAAGKRVLDAACGSGYGTAMLAETAAKVTGVDISAEAIEHCRSQYNAANVEFSEADCMALPFDTGCFELIVAFEIIEHLKDAAGFLREMQRVLAPSGLLVLSTPNRQYYTTERGETNPFHEREFSYDEFDELLRVPFKHCSILLQNHVPAVVIVQHAVGPTAMTIQAMGEHGADEDNRQGAYFFVAVCAQQPLPPFAPLVYVPSGGNVLREREIYIQKLSGYLTEARADLQTLQGQADQLRQSLDERTEWAGRLDAELAEKTKYIAQLQADYDHKVQWAQSLEQDVQRARAALEKLQAEFDERTGWALRLDAELKERAHDLQTLYGSRWYRMGKNLRLTPVPPSDHS
jgi:O-antigen biosynthesis protein